MDSEGISLIIKRLDELSAQLNDIRHDFDIRIKEVERWVEIQKYRMDDVLLTKSEAGKITLLWSLFVLVAGIIGGAGLERLLGS